MSNAEKENHKTPSHLDGQGVTKRSNILYDPNVGSFSPSPEEVPRHPEGTDPGNGSTDRTDRDRRKFRHRLCRGQQWVPRRCFPVTPGGQGCVQGSE